MATARNPYYIRNNNSLCETLSLSYRELLNPRITKLICHCLSAGRIRAAGPHRSVYWAREGARSDRAARAARGAREPRGLPALPIRFVGHWCAILCICRSPNEPRTGWIYSYIYSYILYVCAILIASRFCALDRCARTLRRRRIPGDCRRILWPARAEERAMGPDRENHSLF